MILVLWPTKNNVISLLGNVPSISPQDKDIRELGHTVRKYGDLYDRIAICTVNLKCSKLAGAVSG